MIILILFVLTELGVGWAPAFATDETELQFIKEKQRLSSDNRSFWFGGGLVNLSLQSTGILTRYKQEWLNQNG